MAITATTSLIHWNYFLALESDLEQVSRYIEFSKKNFNTYSIELAHLLLAVSSEVDVIIKALCELKNPTGHRNIYDYRNTVRARIPELISETCSIPRFGLELKPWSNWKGTQDKHPDWWHSYNAVKHHRDQSFDQANLKNVLNAMAALAIVNLYLYKEDTPPHPEKGFRMKDVTRRLKPDASLFRFKPSYHFSNVII